MQNLRKISRSVIVVCFSVVSGLFPGEGLDLVLHHVRYRLFYWATHFRPVVLSDLMISVVNPRNAPYPIPRLPYWSFPVDLMAAVPPPLSFPESAATPR